MEQGTQSGTCPGEAAREKARPAPSLTVPPGWSRACGSGWSLLADAACDERLAFAFSVARGLEERPRSLDFRWLYDDRGSYIFERITEQPEYYQTRTEDGILAAAAARIRETCGPQTLVELGSGSSTKTRRLLDAWCRRGPSRYVPIDVSPGALEPACRALGDAYPELTVEGVAASYDRALPLCAALPPLCLVFLGSSIGNLDQRACDRFLGEVAACLRPGDHFLVGLDLVKDARRLESAYNDAAGWSAAFTRNLFARMGRELGASIDERTIEHVAFYDERLEQIEIYARFPRETMIDLPLAGRRFRVAPGELVRSEISRKFHVDEFAARAARFGLEPVEHFTDPERLFAVLLLRRARRPGVFRAAPALDDKAAIGAQLDGVRRRLLEIVDALPDDELALQHSPLMSPLVWDLVHIARYEELWLVRRLASSSDADLGAGEGLPRDYDALLTPRPARGELDLPSRAAALSLLAETRAAARSTLAAVVLDPRDPLRAGGYAFRMGAQHEAQHTETMLAAMQLRGHLEFPANRGAGADRRGEAVGHATATRLAGDSVLVSAGPFLMGSDDPGRAYDNELPRHEVTLPAFRIDVAPVTNAAWLRFLQAGGYSRRELWTSEGWQWLAQVNARAPGHWILDGRTWTARTFGRSEPLDPDAPVVHVSWFEADAYARWAGKRLPTEAEWEKAAAWDAGWRRPRRYPWGDEEPGASHANLGQRHPSPASIGSYPSGRSFYGCHQMLGDVWEWTSSWFAPYPGFRAFPYREYSEVFFGERYRVLRGGSFATLPVAARCTFRNWDFPERRQIFAGLRCCTDA